MVERQFKIQPDYANRPVRHETIPWSLAEEAWQGYAKAGHGGQSLERIAERGGFGRQEIACALQGHYNDTSGDHVLCMAKLDGRIKGRAANQPWWDDFEKPREGDSHPVQWARGYAGLYAVERPGITTGLTSKQAALLATAFIEMAKRVDALTSPAQAPNSEPLPERQKDTL